MSVRRSGSLNGRVHISIKFEVEWKKFVHFGQLYEFSLVMECDIHTHTHERRTQSSANPGMGTGEKPVDFKLYGRLKRRLGTGEKNVKSYRGCRVGIVSYVL